MKDGKVFFSNEKGKIAMLNVKAGNTSDFQKGRYSVFSGEDVDAQNKSVIKHYSGKYVQNARTPADGYALPFVEPDEWLPKYRTALDLHLSRLDNDGYGIDEKQLAEFRRRVLDALEITDASSWLRHFSSETAIVSSVRSADNER